MKKKTKKQKQCITQKMQFQTFNQVLQVHLYVSQIEILV